MKRRALAWWMLLPLSAAVHVGCGSLYDEWYVSLTDPKLASGGGGSGGGVNPACAAHPRDDGSVVRDECGVFVAASAPAGGDGSKASPYQSLNEALAAGPTRIYVCAESYTETKSVVIDGNVEVFGGFTACSDAWAWSETERATVQGPADVVALHAKSGKVVLESMNVHASAAMLAGGSSLAMVVSGGELSLTNAELVAGDAMAGEAGAQLADDPTLDGEAGTSGVGVCMAGANNPGPKGATKMCATGGQSVGGDGGDGGLINATMMPKVLLAAGSGTDGSPADPNQPTKGKGGVGEDQLTCEDGTSGVPGTPGMSGAGASGIGTMSASGYVGAEGSAGTNGTPGQGGGGGGGAKGGLSITCNMMVADRVGASGGAGGTGGCGGAAGGGGKAGGASVGLVVLGGSVTTSGVTVSVGKGGDGGVGGNGQSGGKKGLGGIFGAGTGLAKDSCNGGTGGQGGPGGPGGGGQGGHSLGVVLAGGTADLTGITQTMTDSAGLGGAGGLGNTTTDGGKGADGITAPCWDFGSNAACGM